MRRNGHCSEMNRIQYQAGSRVESLCIENFKISYDRLARPQALCLNFKFRVSPML